MRDPPGAVPRMTVTLSLLALIVLIGALVHIRRRHEGPAERPPLARPAVMGATSAFHAVSIRLGPNPCEAAQSMASKRFLSSAAPKLPLPNCKNLECKCRFIHHKDRRESEDRRSPFGQSIASTTGTHPKEQRQSEDRRSGPGDKLP
jgi:hypothetical protein